MTPERWQKVEHLLQAALEREPAERAALLELECTGDPDLRAEVESLLSSAQQANGFLAANAAADAAGLLADEPLADALLGSRFGPYSIKKQLGLGGMGEVFLAHDARLDRSVALKLLNPLLTGDRATRTRFLREARLASALDHPNVCTIHEAGEAEGRLFIAMQYVEGETLGRVIDGRPLRLDSLLSISLQVANALAAAHAQGIIHRDIKPGNIIVTAQGQAKVLDFGIAKLQERAEGEADPHLTMTGAVLGTPASMSPEQARGEHVDHRSDIFSFGVVLYQMATGRIPFSGRSKADVISALLNQPHTPVTELNKKITARLSAVIDRALAKEPAERYQTMNEVISDLRQVVREVGGLDRLFSSSEIPLGVVPLVSPKQQGLLGAVGRRIQSHKSVAVWLTIIAVSLVGLALAIYSSRREQPLPATAIKSIAVLPFKPLIAENRDEALELGMADTLINKLSNIRQVTVRPLNAVRQYNRVEQDAVAAGREQRVDAVLDGNIQRSGDKVRVTVRLVRVGDSAGIWTDQFDAPMTDIFAVQDSISERVASALAVKLSSEEKGLLTKRNTQNPDAYRLYLLGRYQLNKSTDDGIRKALENFRQAIDSDPNYALAYVGLADAYIAQGAFDALPPKESFPKAKQAALHALQLDEHLAEAHVSLANARFLYDWDWAGAEDEFKRAIAINPGYSDAHQMYGYYLSSKGRSDEALKEMQRAQELDPLSLPKITAVGEVLYMARRYDEAIAAYQKTFEMDPNSGFAHWALGRAYVEKGLYGEAIAAFQKAIPLSGDSPDEWASLACAYAQSGRKTEARKIIDDLKEQSKKRYVAPSVIAATYAALGERDQGFVWLDKAYDEHDFILVLLKVEPMFDKLRTDPRFTVLLKRVGLEP
jgi:serine/threonine-protein kinase